VFTSRPIGGAFRAPRGCPPHLTLVLACAISSVSPISRADDALFTDASPCVGNVCLSWSREAVVVDSPATLTGTASTFRITGRAPGGETVFDRTIDSLDPSPEQPSVASALADAGRAIVNASPRPVTVSAPTLVESTSIQVASVPLAILASTPVFDHRSFNFSAFGWFCVGDLGEGPSPSSLPANVGFGCKSGFSKSIGWTDWIFSPPWLIHHPGTLDDSHVSTRLEVHRTAVFTGTLNLRHLELIGEEPVGETAGPGIGGAR